MAWCLIKNGGNFTFSLTKVTLPMDTGGSFRGVQAAGREADHSTSSSAGVKNSRFYFYSPIPLMASYLIKNGGNFTFSLTKVT
jgi:hypothetical protein